MYDWANSSYSLVITSAIFPIYFHKVVTANGSEVVQFLGRSFNSASLLTYALSASFLIIAALSPLLSSLADYSGRKKAFMYFFCTLGSVACSTMFFFDSTDTIAIGIFGFMLAAIGYSGSIVFYNAFLPEIAEPKDQDRVSARGFALGYIGSSMLMIFSLSMILFPQWYNNVDAGFASRLAFLLVGIWWFAFAQITFVMVPENTIKRPVTRKIFLNGYQELQKVWKQLRELKRLKMFLLAFFFYNMGTQTVMYVATIFGENELKLPTEILIVVILIIQFVAIAGAYLFSYLSGKYGNVRALSIAITAWIFICIAAYFDDRRFGVNEQTTFIIIAAFVGMVMGGIQSLSRSTYSKLLPETTDHASYFSFFDVCDKVGTVAGTFMYGFVIEATGNMRNSIIGLILFFIIGLILLLRLPKKKISNWQ